MAKAFKTFAIIEPIQPVNTVPPISLDVFLEKTGLARSTAYRYEKQGWLKTHIISNRRFLLAEDVAEFNRRLKAGEFAVDVMPNPHARGRAKAAERGVVGPEDARK
ncbi:MAG TPA: hypothetical protein VIT91_18125 [Chthoniobacterales bacterium]